MAIFVTQLTIGDYTKWRPIFDKHKDLRDKVGVRSARVYRDADDPRELIVFGETSDAAKTRDGLASQEMRSAMQEAGVVGPPIVHSVP